MITRFNTDKRCYCAPIPRPIADRYCKCGCNNLFSPKRVDQVYLNKQHADFAYNRGMRKVKNEKMIEVQKILLKNDKIIFLVKKFMVNTTRVAHTIIRPEVIRLERLLFMP
jgi:hypothetical protein